MIIKFGLIFLLIGRTLLGLERSLANFGYQKLAGASATACLLPLATGNRWHYNLVKNGKVIDSVSITMDQHRIIHSGGLSPYRHTFKIRYKFKKHNKSIEIVQALDGTLYRLDKGTLTPFLSNYFLLGQSIGNMTLVDIKIGTFNTQSNQLAILQNKDATQIEHYLSHTGLLYQLKDGIEYKLVSAKINSEGCVIAK